MQVKYILGFLIVVMLLSTLLILMPFKKCQSLGGLMAGTSFCLFALYFILALFLGFNLNIRKSNLSGWKDWIYTMYVIVGGVFCALQGCLLQHKIINFIEKFFNR